MKAFIALFDGTIANRTLVADPAWSSLMCLGPETLARRFCTSQSTPRARDAAAFLDAPGGKRLVATQQARALPPDEDRRAMTLFVAA
jgi:hypothetical protein